MINIENKIKTVLAISNKTQTEISKDIGMTQANFNRKLKNQTLSLDELEKIAQAVGAEFNLYFKFPDGNKI